MDILQSLTAARENKQFSFIDWLPEIQYQCPNCEGLFADQYHDEAEGEVKCPACIELASDPPSPSINIAQLNAEDFQFFIFRYGGKPLSLNCAYLRPQKMEFSDLHALFKKPVTPKKIFQQVCRKTEEIYLECFFQSLRSDLQSTKSNPNDSPEHRAIVAFKRLVAGTQPGTIDPSYVKRLDLRGRWLWIGAITKEALPEETLLSNFFYYHCVENGADYP